MSDPLMSDPWSPSELDHGAPSEPGASRLRPSERLRLTLAILASELGVSSGPGERDTIEANDPDSTPTNDGASTPPPPL